MTIIHTDDPTIAGIATGHGLPVAPISGARVVSEPHRIPVEPRATILEDDTLPEWSRHTMDIDTPPPAPVDATTTIRWTPQADGGFGLVEAVRRLEDHVDEAEALQAIATAQRRLGHHLAIPPAVMVDTSAVRARAGVPLEDRVTRLEHHVRRLSHAAVFGALVGVTVTMLIVGAFIAVSERIGGF